MKKTKSVNKYIVVRTNRISDLQTEVNCLIKKQYSPSGSMVIHVDDFGVFYYQPMVKSDD